MSMTCPSINRSGPGAVNLTDMTAFILMAQRVVQLYEIALIKGVEYYTILGSTPYRPKV